MSDSRDPGKPGGDKEKEDTLSKYIQRMKTVLKGPRRAADMDRRSVSLRFYPSTYLVMLIYWLQATAGCSS